jgi:chromate transporter
MSHDARVSYNDHPGGPSRISILALFLACARVALSSFGGGVPALMHREFVERQQTLSESGFAAAFALARIMPGANVVNLAVLIGYRARGALGATTAALGLLVGPTVLSIVLVILYDSAVGIASLAVALNGAAAGAAGLLIAMALQSTMRLMKKSRSDKRAPAAIPLALSIAAGVFALVGIFGVRTVWVVLCFVPISVAVSYATAMSSAKEARNDPR